MKLSRPKSKELALFAEKFVCQLIGPIYFSKSLDNGTGVDGHGAGLVFTIKKIGNQGLNIAVENNAHKLALPVDHWAARIAAYDICRADEVERSGKVQDIPLRNPAVRQVERSSKFVLSRSLI